MTLAVMTTRVEPQADAELLLAARLRRGESGALEELINLHQSAVVRLANRLLGWGGDVEDVVQDVFLTALEKCSSFRGKSSLKTWLTIITLNRCRTHLRRRKIWQRVIASVTRQARPDSAASDAGAVSDEVGAEVRAAVAALAPRDREVVVLFYLEQKPVCEIASLLAVSSNAIEVRLHRARAKLRGSLQAFMKE
jgi:RNA polymerase sigma-70 factor (ECF subfamily)